MPNEGNTPWHNMLSYLIHAKDCQKHQYVSECLTIVGEDYQISTRQMHHRRKGSAPEKQKNKNTQANEFFPNRCLINQNHDNEASRARYIENIQNQEYI